MIDMDKSIGRSRRQAAWFIWCRCWGMLLRWISQEWKKRILYGLPWFFMTIQSMGDLQDPNRWRYVNVPYKAMFCGDIPWNLGLKNKHFFYGRYLQSIGSCRSPIEWMTIQQRPRWNWQRWIGLSWIQSSSNHEKRGSDLTYTPWILGKCHHDRSLFSRSLEIMVNV